MPVLSVLCAGVSTTGIEYITEAVNQAFGECSVQELHRDDLRFKVRLGTKDTSVVLIILDTTSMDECKDIENGLFSSDKFYKYVGDGQLVSYLNEKYDLNMDFVVEDLTSVTPDGASASNCDEEVIERYRSQIADKDGIIKNLTCTVKELESIISEGGYSVDTSKVEGVEAENLELRGKVLDLQKVVDTVNQEVENYKKNDSALKDENAKLTDKIGILQVKNEDVIKTLATERELSSQKSAVIRDKEKDILKLQEEIKGIRVTEININNFKSEISDLKSRCKNLQLENKNLVIDLDSKDSEIRRLGLDLEKRGEYDEKVSEYKKMLSTLEKEKSDLAKELNDVRSDYNSLVTQNNELNEDLDTYADKLTALEEKCSETEGYLSQANVEKIKLEDKLKVLETSTNRDADVEATITELSELKKKYAELQTNIFTVIGTKSLPKCGIKAPLIKGIPPHYSNVKFIFSGSSESRKGTYKCLYNELTGSKDKYLILDVTSETAIDYVFQMKKIVDGMNWFTSGGGVQQYLSSTCLPNVKVLMPKIGYVNDSFFLMVNWEKRLKELEESGYKVIVYCGDISNLVGRVLLESFSELGDTLVYVHGNALGSRTIIANAFGLTGIKLCTVLYYDFDKSIFKFYKMMESKANCKIVSYARS